MNEHSRGKRSAILSWIVGLVTVIVLVGRLCYCIRTGQSMLHFIEVSSFSAFVVGWLLGHSVRRFLRYKKGGAAPLETLIFVPLAFVLGVTLWCS